METSPKSKEPILSTLTLSPGDSHAKTSAKPESESASRALARAFGLNSPALLGNLDLDTFLLRTSQASLFQEQCPEWSESWPDSGMWDAGSVYELQTSEQVILERESSLWPTAQARDQKSANLIGSGNYQRKLDRGFTIDLNDRAANWPTATGGDAKASGAAGYSTESGRHSGTTLTDAVCRSLQAPPIPDGLKSSATGQTSRRRLVAGLGRVLSNF